MELEAVKQRAKAREERLKSQPTEAAETFRADVMAFFARVPEPPLYRRRDDPARKAAAGLLEEGEALLARGWRLGADVAAHTAALEQHLAALCLVDEGRVEAAAREWQRALAQERQASAANRLWRRTDEAHPPVFDSTTRRSRYDPRPEPTVEVKLACPWCQKPGDFTLPPRIAMHSLHCLHCAQGFAAYLAEVRSLEVERLKGNRRRYVFRVEELTGAQSRVEFEHVGTEELVAAPRDLIAFLYGPPTILRGVLNLNSSRVLWLPSVGPCFVATAVFGEGAAELAVLRGFRDRVLLPRRGGRAFVRWYYREGPALSRVVGGRPWLKRATRLMLSGVASAIERTQR
ncbi:MAG: CFI-box-CTERM domain-containing protein [Myxococcota bacterium]